MLHCDDGLLSVCLDYLKKLYLVRIQNATKLYITDVDLDLFQKANVMMEKIIGQHFNFIYQSGSYYLKRSLNSLYFYCNYY